MNAYRENTVSVEEAFDVDRMARFCAIVDMYGHLQHSARLSNLRFYYNPEVKRLEPVGYDQSYIHRWRGRLGNDRWLIGEYLANDIERTEITFTNSLSRSDAFLDAYWKHLARYSAPGYIDALMTSFDGPYQVAMKKLARDKPFFNLHEPEQELRNNAAAIHEYLQTRKP